MQLGWLAMVGFDSEAGLRALADPRRRRMLALVWDRERSSSDLARRCELSRPAASQHLRVLRRRIWSACGPTGTGGCTGSGRTGSRSCGPCWTNSGAAGWLGCRLNYPDPNYPDLD